MFDVAHSSDVDHSYYRAGARLPLAFLSDGYVYGVYHNVKRGSDGYVFGVCHNVKSGVTNVLHCSGRERDIVGLIDYPELVTKKYVEAYLFAGLAGLASPPVIIR